MKNRRLIHSVCVREKWLECCRRAIRRNMSSVIITHNPICFSLIPIANEYCVVTVEASKILASGRKILDYASDSSSDQDALTSGNTWRAQDMDNSDNESIDSQNEDLLKYVDHRTICHWIIFDFPCIFDFLCIFDFPCIF